MQRVRVHFKPAIMLTSTMNLFSGSAIREKAQVTPCRLIVFGCLLSILSACGSPPKTRPNTLYEPQRLDRSAAEDGIETTRLLPPPPTELKDDTQAADSAPSENPKALDSPIDENDADDTIRLVPPPSRPTIDIDDLRDRASSGDTDAQYRLGMLLLRDQPLEQNFDAATEWLNLASDSGDHRAKYALGDLHYNGLGQATDYGAARTLWLDSAILGNDQAQLKLGYMYSEGIGVEQDYEAAKRWYLKSASLGNAEAQTLLGSLLHEGNRLPPDYEQAFKWYQLAARQGHAHAQYTLATLFHDGLGTPVDFIYCSAWIDVAVANGYDDHLGAKRVCEQTLSADDKEAASRLADEMKARFGPQRAGLL